MRYSFTLPDEYVSKLADLPAIMRQNLIENAIKQAIDNLDTPTFIAASGKK